MMYPVKLSEDSITGYLIDERKQRELKGGQLDYQQLSLFDLPSMPIDQPFPIAEKGGHL